MVEMAQPFRDNQQYIADLTNISVVDNWRLHLAIEYSDLGLLKGLGADGLDSQRFVGFINERQYAQVTDIPQTPQHRIYPLRRFR